MTKDEALKLALMALEVSVSCTDMYYVPIGKSMIPEVEEAIAAIKEALAQPEQEYHRGDRLICLETEEYCVIHISGTDRQWVKFPDSHIGVYTNEQVAELFELLPKEPKQEPVAVRYDFDGYGYQYIDSGSGSDWQTRVQGEPLYTAPHPEQYPQIAINPEIVGYVAPQRKPLTDEEMKKIWYAMQNIMGWYSFQEIARAIEAAHGIKEKNT